jgi:hypothetical protein
MPEVKGTPEMNLNRLAEGGGTTPVIKTKDDVVGLQVTEEDNVGGGLVTGDDQGSNGAGRGRIQPELEVERAIGRPEQDSTQALDWERGGLEGSPRPGMIPFQRVIVAGEARKDAEQESVRDQSADHNALEYPPAGTRAEVIVEEEPELRRGEE